MSRDEQTGEHQDPSRFIEEIPEEFKSRASAAVADVRSNPSGIGVTTPRPSTASSREKADAGVQLGHKTPGIMPKREIPVGIVYPSGSRPPPDGYAHQTPQQQQTPRQQQQQQQQCSGQSVRLQASGQSMRSAGHENKHEPNQDGRRREMGMIREEGVGPAANGFSTAYANARSGIGGGTPTRTPQTSQSGGNTATAQPCSTSWGSKSSGVILQPWLCGRGGKVGPEHEQYATKTRADGVCDSPASNGGQQFVAMPNTMQRSSANTAAPGLASAQPTLYSVRLEPRFKSSPADNGGVRTDPVSDYNNRGTGFHMNIPASFVTPRVVLGSAEAAAEFGGGKERKEAGDESLRTCQEPLFSGGRASRFEALFGGDRFAGQGHEDERAALGLGTGGVAVSLREGAAIQKEKRRQDTSHSSRNLLPPAKVGSIEEEGHLMKRARAEGGSPPTTNIASNAPPHRTLLGFSWGRRGAR